MAIRQDTVFLGMTRPAQLWGTHWGAIIGITVVTLYAFTFTDELWTLGLCVPLYAVSWSISRYDPNAFRLVGLFLLTRSKSLANASYWRASSSSPFPKRGY